MSATTTTYPKATGTSTLVRPKFAPGMLLQHEDLDLLGTYTRDLSRLLFRSFFGCGVVCGLVVKPDRECGEDVVEVSCGLGLNCAGDPVYVPRPTTVVIDQDCKRNPNDKLWVILCATSKCCAPRTSMCPDDDDSETSCTRERFGFDIRVLPDKDLPKCVCWCKPKDTQGQGDPQAPQVELIEAADTSAGDDPDVDVTVDTATYDCLDCGNKCYDDHYKGLCDCDECSGSGSCCCDCIVLARLTYDGTKEVWKVDHSVRRFIRPVLMRDWKAWDEKHPATTKESYAVEASPRRRRRGARTK